jgi:hypothetical protein
VSVVVLIFGSSVTREMPLPFFPLRGVLVSIDFLHWSGGSVRAYPPWRVIAALHVIEKLAAFAADGHAKSPRAGISHARLCNRNRLPFARGAV